MRFPQMGAGSVSRDPSGSCVVGDGPPPAPAHDPSVLLETGDHLLLESGDELLLE